MSPDARLDDPTRLTASDPGGMLALVESFPASS